ncbi:ZAP1 [Candida pseudojiufengensis]|uniref:ZAP1 n=1 Tax=Candida pseudojiufengensis TaxID=497109 RepID=UPI0022249E41|nr:ZAP1 [Candida pseudojiufengensis]KAI5959410.1 ZAP1 [Candida pseudojiufengensis]
MKLDNNTPQNITTCKDSFCDELDDCFFINNHCDDGTHNSNFLCDSSCWTVCCDDENCIPTLKSQRKSANHECCEEHISNKIECCNEPDCDTFEVPEDFKFCHDEHCTFSPRDFHNELMNQCDSSTFRSNLKRSNSEIQTHDSDIRSTLKRMKHNNFQELENHLTNDVQVYGKGETKEQNSSLKTQEHNYQTTLNENQAQNLTEIDRIMKYNIPTSNCNSSSKIDQDILQYSCQWEHCFKKLNEDTFMNHIVGDHISQEQNFGKSSSFQCEWRDCNFSNINLENLLDHLETHKFSNTVSSSSPNVNVLTPLSSTSNPQDDSPSEPKTHQEVDSEVSNASTAQDQSNKSACFSCNWQVGTTENGQPIPCSSVHHTEGELQDHIVNEHIGSGKSTYCCDWIGCDRHKGKIFNQRQKLYRHIHVHTNYKPCKCKTCGASFAVESMLVQHLRIHSGEKPFSCKICGKKFATSSSLSIHNRVHTGEKPLKCKWPGCGKSFSESSNLTKHMKIHTKTFVCEVCGESFIKKTDHTKHMKFHNEKEFNKDGSNNNLITSTNRVTMSNPNSVEYISI